jgi:hypothetical protein
MKFKKQKKRKPIFPDISALFPTTCKTCNGERIKVKWEDVPKEPQEAFKEMIKREGGYVDYYLFCPVCKQYSVSFVPEMF